MPDFAGAIDGLRDELVALRHDLHHLGPIRLSDVEAAQDELARLAVRLESEGSITVPHAALTTAA